LATRFGRLDFDESADGGHDEEAAVFAFEDDCDDEDDDEDEDGAVLCSYAGGSGVCEEGEAATTAVVAVTPLSVPGLHCARPAPGVARRTTTSGAGAAAALCVVTASPAYRNASLAAFPLLAVAYAGGAVELRLVATEVAPLFEASPLALPALEAAAGAAAASAGTPLLLRAASVTSAAMPGRSPALRRYHTTPAAATTSSALLQATQSFVSAQLPAWRALLADATQSFAAAARRPAAPLTRAEVARALAETDDPALFARARAALGLGDGHPARARRHAAAGATALGASAALSAAVAAWAAERLPSELERAAVELELLGALAQPADVAGGGAPRQGLHDPLDFAAFADALARHAQVKRKQ
jgi:hypothetical protein